MASHTKCKREEEARDRAAELIPRKHWPVYFFTSDTTGEKDFEEFYTDAEVLDMDRFESVGVIKNKPQFDQTKLDQFLREIARFRDQGRWDKPDIVGLFHEMIPDFEHKETGKYLDNRM